MTQFRNGKKQMLVTWETRDSIRTHVTLAAILLDEVDQTGASFSLCLPIRQGDLCISVTSMATEGSFQAKGWM
jgi:hypothetical protein